MRGVRSRRNVLSVVMLVVMLLDALETSLDNSRQSNSNSNILPLLLAAKRRLWLAAHLSQACCSDREDFQASFRQTNTLHTRASDDQSKLRSTCQEEAGSRAA